MCRWVALIIIGAVLIATPFYLRACPEGLKDEDRVAAFTAKKGANTGYDQVNQAEEGLALEVVESQA